MSKIVLDNITSGYDLSKINSNFQKIEDEFNDKVLYRNPPDGEPNSLEKDIDVNSKILYNLPSPSLSHQAATKGYVDSVAFGSSEIIEENFLKKENNLSDLSDVDAARGILNVPEDAVDISYLPAGIGAEVTTVHAKLREFDELFLTLPNPGVDDTIAKINSFMQQTLTDYRGDTLPNYFRRVVEYRRPIGGGDIFEVVAEKSINTTAIGYCLRYFAGIGEKYLSMSREYMPVIRQLADMVVAMQHIDDRKARYGGFALAPKDGTASAYGAGMCGLGLLSAYRLTLDPVYLNSAMKAAQFLNVLHNPNPTYAALYGVTPIPAVAQNADWNGFCDQISAGDTILTAHSTWNILASKFLKELFEITGDTAYQTLYQNTRDWGSEGVTGFYDFWAVYHSGALPSFVSNNWFATGLVVSDGEWHKRGESVISGGAVRTSTINAATSTTVTLDGGASSINDFYTGMALRMTSGDSNAKGTIITGYNGVTKVATIKYPFPITPSPGDSYQVGLSANTIGSDQMEYGIESLYDTGYNLEAIRSAYETICSWANADTGAFGTAYDSRICWTGYFRPDAGVYGGQSRAFGTQYDIQGIGPLLKFKKEQYPEHWAVSFAVALQIPNVATLVDKDFNTIWSTDATGLFEYTTVGTGTVKGTIGLGIVESFNA